MSLTGMEGSSGAERGLPGKVHIPGARVPPPAPGLGPEGYLKYLWLQPLPVSSLLLAVTLVHVLFCLNLSARTLRGSQQISHPMFKNSPLAGTPLVLTTNTAECLPYAGRVLPLGGPQPHPSPVQVGAPLLQLPPPERCPPWGPTEILGHPACS